MSSNERVAQVTTQGIQIGSHLFLLKRLVRTVSLLQLVYSPYVSWHNIRKTESHHGSNYIYKPLWDKPCGSRWCCS